MDGFTLHKRFSYVVFEHTELQFTMMVYKDGSGDFFHWFQGDVVHIPTVHEINLGGFLQPKTFDNIRHDLVHVWYCYVSRRTLSPNHQKLMAIADTPLWRCHWEEYKVESLELYVLTGQKREALEYYDRAKAFVDWIMSTLQS